MGQLLNGPRVLQVEVPVLKPQSKQPTDFGNSAYANSAYGALFEPQVDIDDAYKFQFDFTLNFPLMYDIRTAQASPYPPIRNQGTLGACTAYAAVGAIECTSRRAHKLPLWELSPLYLYVKTLEESPAKAELVDTGSTIFSVLKTALDTGVASTKVWPTSTTPWNTLVSPAAQQDAGRYKVAQLGRLSQDLYQFKTGILAGFAIAFSFAITHQGNEWMKSPEAQYPSFVYPSPQGAQDLDKVVGAHAVVMVGYNDLTKLFTIRNSWGPVWGDQGHFYITYNMMLQPFWTRDFYIVLGLR